MFTTFEVYYAAHGALGAGALGRYCQATRARPVCWIDLRTCDEAAVKLGCTLRYVVRTTVLHELAHAIQEWHGLPFDEDQAEAFAYQFYMFESIYRFWEVGQTKAEMASEDDVPF